jgi:hypothetical protein
LLEVFHLEDVFVVGSGLKVNEKHGEGELGAMVSDVPYVGDVEAEPGQLIEWRDELDVRVSVPERSRN